MALTHKQLENARYGRDKERLADGNGLFARLYPNGMIRFQVQVPNAPDDKRRTWITLGTFPDLSIKLARGKAAEVRGWATQGWDAIKIRETLKTKDTPSSEIEKPSVRRAPQAAKPGPAVRTLREAAREWFEVKSGQLSNGKHIQQNWTTLATYVLPHLGHLDIKAITTPQIIDVLEPHWNTRPETARRTLARLRKVFGREAVRGRITSNPAAFEVEDAFGRNKKEVSHHTGLDASRMPEFWQWLETVDCDPRIKGATQLLALTAKRTGETRFAQWDFLDDARTVWTTPRLQTH